jgi:Ca2+-binding EF-hand superfamily protein
MKRFLLAWPTAAGLISLAASIAAAQSPGPPGRGGPGPGGGFGGRMAGSALLQALDADGDGELSAKEIENATAALKTLDKDNDGKLSREELRPSPGGRAQGPPGSAAAVAQQMVAQLMTFDKNGDGKLSKEEVPEGIHALITRADANKDGFVDRAELTAFAIQAARRNSGNSSPDGSGPRRRPSTPPTNST